VPRRCGSARLCLLRLPTGRGNRPQEDSGKRVLVVTLAKAETFNQWHSLLAA
jgi:hypothetical protein